MQVFTAGEEQLCVRGADRELTKSQRSVGKIISGKLFIAHFTLQLRGENYTTAMTSKLKSFYGSNLACILPERVQPTLDPYAEAFL